MGKYWLHDLPAECAKRGVTVETYSGWETRSRSTGGFDDIRGVCMHHTAGSGRYPENDMAYMWLNAQYRPVGNIYLAVDGTITLGTAGASNTQGKGGPLPSSKGTVPLNEGNKYYIAIEAANDGVGAVWPEAQLAAYEALVSALCDIYDLDSDTDVVLHATWAPTRKIDPAGPTPHLPTWGGLTGAKTWDLHAVRTTINNSQPPISMSEFKTTDPVRIVDTRTGTNFNSVQGEMSSGDVISIKPHGYTPADATGVMLAITAIGNSPCYFTLWSGETPSVPIASQANPSPGVLANNCPWVKIHRGVFKVYMGGADGTGHIVIDQVGWYWD